MVNDQKSGMDVFDKIPEKNPGGVMTIMFRSLLLRLGKANKLRALCKDAQVRDKLYRDRINSSVFDSKLEYRLYQMATAPKMTFDSLVKLVTHLLDITEFKFTISVKPRGSENWVTIEHLVTNQAGPMIDMSGAEDIENDKNTRTKTKQKSDT